jgi:hypothetical protein
MVSVRYEFGIIIRPDSIRDLFDQIEPVGSSSDPVLRSYRSDTDFHNSWIELDPELVKFYGLQIEPNSIRPRYRSRIRYNQPSGNENSTIDD